MPWVCPGSGWGGAGGVDSGQAGCEEVPSTFWDLQIWVLRARPVNLDLESDFMLKPINQPAARGTQFECRPRPDLAITQAEDFSARCTKKMVGGNTLTQGLGQGGVKGGGGGSP